MIGITEILIELASFQMFASVKSVDYRAISKDHIGDVEAIFNNQTIKVQVYNGDDGESVAKKIINKAEFKR